MGKLAGRGMPSRLRPARSRLNRAPRAASTEAAADAARPAWHKWYFTARWRRLRWSVLVGASFTCGWCGRFDHDTSRLVADHKTPHRGDAALFWDPANLQCLCKRCHDRDKQRLEARTRGEGG